jgi:hypothetical protein
MTSLNPWYRLYSFAPPDFPFCGEIVNGFISDPADTYSSLFYFAVALLLFIKSRSKQFSGQSQFYAIPILITIGSILFHMSFSFVFLMADFFGIFMLTFYCIAMNLIRLKIIGISYFYRRIFIAAALYTSTMIIAYKFHFHSGVLMIPLLIVLAVLENKCFKTNKNIDYKSFIIGCSLAFIGYVFMLLEGKPFHMGCAGTALYFHSVWHLFSACSFYYIFLFYQQFNLISKKIYES